MMYDYKCPDCGKIYECNQRHGDWYCDLHGDDAPVLARIYDIPGISFKGSGFYSTDNPK